jgi:hypothetical protein
MTPEKLLLIVKIIELVGTYGAPLVIAGINAIQPKEDLTMADIDELELKLKHPLEYMPRPE